MKRVKFFYQYFHKITVFCAVVYLGWGLWSMKVETPDLGIVIQSLLPIFDNLAGGNATSPSDFVNFLKYYTLWRN